jgi:molecular chaperone HscB
VAAHDNTAMPADFLLQQMSWREALDEAPDGAAVQRLDDDVAAHERDWLERLRAELDDRGDVAAAARTVRELMFAKRFRSEVERRLDALES